MKFSIKLSNLLLALWGGTFLLATASFGSDRPSLFLAADDSDHPRCLEVSNSPVRVFFRWKESDHYARETEARLSTEPCSEWRKVVGDLEFWENVPADADHVFGFSLPSDFQDRMFSIRMGGDEYRPGDQTAVEYLRSHPIQQYTLATNVELTRRFGHGFSGAVYRAWVESKKSNSEFRADLDGKVDQILSIGESATDLKLAEASKNTVVLVSMGLAWDKSVQKNTPAYVKTFLDQIQSLGIKVEILDHQAMGTLEENRSLLAPQVSSHLARGENVILFSMCKGAPELLGATTDVLSPYLTHARTQESRPQGYGRVVGVLNLSAMLDGIIFGDYSSNKPLLLDFGRLLSGVPFFSSIDQYGQYAEVMPDLTSENVANTKASFVPGLPSDATYVSAIGVMPGNGLITDNTTAMKPFVQADRLLNIAHAANDGFIRYPGNELPDGVSDRQYSFVLDASHMLSDGMYGRYSLKIAENEKALYRALLLFVLGSDKSSI